MNYKERRAYKTWQTALKRKATIGTLANLTEPFNGNVFFSTAKEASGCFTSILPVTLLQVLKSAQVNQYFSDLWVTGQLIYCV